MPGVTLIKGDATERWPLPDNHLASIVTDPPYGLKFMGKAWDDKGGPVAYQMWTTTWAREAFRCLKPGGFLLAFGATRMAHRMTCGFEDAGFEILDGIEWLYLSGMPKAQDIGKLFDKRAGAEREVVGTSVHKAGIWNGAADHYTVGGTRAEHYAITAPASDLARQWDGWKTPSLKPAHEPIVVARKPFPGTYCENLEQWGVGAINVDGCRVPGDMSDWHASTSTTPKYGRNSMHASATINDPDRTPHAGGRFPANVVMSHGPDCTLEACQDGCPVKVLDAQSGLLVSKRSERGDGIGKGYHGSDKPWNTVRGHDDAGGASKVFAKFFWDQDDYAAFYYCPKASASEKNAGCEHLKPQTVRVTDNQSCKACGICGRKFPNNQHECPQCGGALVMTEVANAARGNFHPTVKPTGLIRYLQRLVTPPGGRTGSPFLGSGTDAVAAIREGFDFWGMNLPDHPGEEYWPIIDARVAHALKADGEPRKPAETTAQTAPSRPEQARFCFDQAEGTVNP